MKFQRTQEPVLMPVSVAEAKAHINVEHSDHDEIIDMQIKQAVDFAENWTGRQLMSQVWTLYLDCWCDSDLPFIPLQGVSISYTDVNGEAQTLPPDGYVVDLKAYPAKIYFTSRPALQDAYNTVRISCTCGYANVNDVPKGIETAILLMVGELYNNREGSAPIKLEKIPFGIESFLNQYKVAF